MTLYLYESVSDYIYTFVMCVTYSRQKEEELVANLGEGEALIVLAYRMLDKREIQEVLHLKRNLVYIKRDLRVLPHL